LYCNRQKWNACRIGIEVSETLNGLASPRSNDNQFEMFYLKQVSWFWQAQPVMRLLIPS
jgi:hypothetical protein